ncbi:MAG: hypothetical protein UT43_C0043G0010 [Parcubacteria group bacterium GW2011_GWC1_39_29]|nr:MAG: hypothetical protein UT43_C0043G0010 [Parcubacteria group bacterium GW2011_GWC1_39_29]
MLLFVFVTLLILGVFLSLYSSVIFQEGNPWPQVKGIVQLNFSNTDMVKLSGSDNKYITKSDNPEIIKSFMKEKGYDFTEQMGAGHLFKSPSGESAVAVHRYYSHYYSLWNITEHKENSIVEGLRDCLPKSDMASHEKCNELLKQITDYNSCVGAGFSIMKSNPPQCATPDGRTFVRAN